MSSSITTQTTLNRQRLYRVTSRILNRNSLHFILISLLFYPLIFFASEAAKFYLSTGRFPSSSDYDVNTMFDPFNLYLIKTIARSSSNLLTVKTLISALAFTCFVILPAIAGIALITFSTNQVINHQPLTFSSTLKSLSHSFILILHTLTSGLIIIIILFLVFTLAPLTITEVVKLLRLDVNLFIFSIVLNTILSYALPITIVFFVTIWGSAFAITVLESKSGFETLRQSASQSTEFRHHSFSIVYITGFVGGSALGCSTIAQNFGLTAKWILVVQTVVICLQSSLTILLYAVANTVLYVQSKVESDEERMVEIREVSGEYVRVAVNDHKDGEVVHEPNEKEEEDANGGYNRLFYLLAMFWMIFFPYALVRLM